jgi:hypothetical protein
LPACLQQDDAAAKLATRFTYQQLEYFKAVVSGCAWLSGVTQQLTVLGVSRPAAAPLLSRACGAPPRRPACRSMTRS